jgi:hypothetical protein
MLLVAMAISPHIRSSTGEARPKFPIAARAFAFANDARDKCLLIPVVVLKGWAPFKLGLQPVDVS